LLFPDQEMTVKRKSPVDGMSLHDGKRGAIDKAEIVVGE
jgi:hypothetical protein